MKEHGRVAGSFLLGKPGQGRWPRSNIAPCSPTPAHWQWDGRADDRGLQTWVTHKGSGWESGPAVSWKDWIQRWPRKQKWIFGERIIHNWTSVSFFPGVKGKTFGYDQNSSPLAGQAQLCFALAWLLYKSKVELRRNALPGSTALLTSRRLTELATQVTSGILALEESGKTEAAVVKRGTCKSLSGFMRNVGRMGMSGQCLYKPLSNYFSLNRWTCAKSGWLQQDGRFCYTPRESLLFCGVRGVCVHPCAYCFITISACFPAWISCLLFRYSNKK